MTGKEQPLTVLIVDDDKGLARLIEKAVRREGCATAVALSGEETLRWLQTHTADLMLLDLKLPDFTGTDLIDRLESIGKILPFIIITGQGDERVAVDMMKRGALDYLIKDAQFLEFVPTVVRRARAQLENERRLATAEAHRKRLEKEILEISEREQQRIGQDLHDDLGQQLAGIWCLSRVLESSLITQKSPEAKNATEITGLLKNALALTRALARGLHPVALDTGGLSAALVELAQRTSDLFRVRCRSHCQELEVANTVATHLYRIAQEAVTNAVKHGQAKEIEIELSANPHQILLSIRDYGTGLPEDLDPARPGMGLRIMNYRAGMIGGILKIDGCLTGGGTLVTCTLPQPAIEACLV